MSDSETGSHFLEIVRSEFRSQKRQADRALAQVDDRAFFAMLDAESNSLAVIVKHVGGNLRSRWQDFLTSDGEKPDRHRDDEFVVEGETRPAIMDRWETGWRLLTESLAALTPDDLLKPVTIRGEPHSVVKAIQRSLTHTSGHVGQIVFLAKHLAGEKWQTLTIPRGQSETFNARMRERTSA